MVGMMSQDDEPDDEPNSSVTNYVFESDLGTVTQGAHDDHDFSPFGQRPSKKIRP